MEVQIKKSQKQNKYNKNIDIMKAIGIILMVMGHSGVIWKDWIYQFHMVIFFVIAGFCYNQKYSSNIKGIKKLIIKKIKSLYLPCVIFTTCIVLLHNPLRNLNLIGGEYYSIKKIIISLIKCLLFSGGEDLSGAMWFLRTMFFTIIVYAVLDFICNKIICGNKEIFKSIISLFLLVISFLCVDQSFGPYLNILTAVSVFHIGFLVQKIHWKFEIDIKYSILIIFVSSIFITILCLFGTIDLFSNQIVNPVHFVIGTIAGTVMCYGLTALIAKSRLVNLMIWIGTHTLSIVMLHFFCMKLVTLLQVVVYQEPIERLQKHPYLYVNGAWWLLYTIVGVSLPLILYQIYSRIYYKIKKESERR